MRTKPLKVAVCATALKIAQHRNIDLVSIKPKLLHAPRDGPRTAARIRAPQALDRGFCLCAQRLAPTDCQVGSDARIETPRPLPASGALNWGIE